MAKCVSKNSVQAVLSLDVLLNEDGRLTVGPLQLNLPPFSLLGAGRGPVGLRYAGNNTSSTVEQSVGGTIDFTFPPLVGTAYSGAINSKLKLQFSSDLYTDCDPDYCIKGRYHDINTLLLYETTLGIDLTSANVAFPDIAFGQDCREPEWILCCRETDVELKWDLDEFQITSKLRLTLEGRAKLDFEIWRRAAGARKENSSGEYKKTSSVDGTHRFELIPNSAFASVPLPASLGGGQVAIQGISGFAVVRTGEVVGGLIRLTVEELHLQAPPVKLKGGRSSGINYVLLAPGRCSTGWLDASTGQVRLEIQEIIFNEMFSIKNPLRVTSNVVGHYDFGTETVRLVGRSVDEFPLTERRSKSTGRPKKKRP